jgi:predicted metal-binding membrane protein
MTPHRTTDRPFYAALALLFAASVALTIWSTSMQSMSDMSMPSGAMMPSAWTPMPGQSWTGAAGAFLAMWTVMMVAMMLPALLPMLERYRATPPASGAANLGALTALVTLGYFAAWTLFGALVFPLGAALTTLAMQSPLLARVLPLAAGLVVILAGAFQFTQWKTHYLTCCRAAPRAGAALAADATTALRYGLGLGFDCVRCCANLIAVLLVIGLMDPRPMLVVAAAIAIERMAPAGRRVAQLIGLVVMAAGLALIAQASLG